MKSAGLKVFFRASRGAPCGADAGPPTIPKDRRVDVVLFLAVKCWNVESGRRSDPSRWFGPRNPRLVNPAQNARWGRRAAVNRSSGQSR